jgi:arylformamidase
MPSFDPEWLAVQYNNRARVSDSAQIMERWGKASAHAREGLSCRLDVPYGDGPNEVLDFFPASQPKAPILVFIHGGWWRALDKRDHSFLAPGLVDAGATVVIPNYALCPGAAEQPVNIESITLQMVKALAWVHRHAAELGDAKRIVVAGHSAGGHLAAMMLSCDWKAVAPDLPARLVHSALAVSGVYELEPLRNAPFLQSDLKLTPESAAKLSPALFPKPRGGQLCALVGALESEEHLRQNRLIQQAWGTGTVPVCEAIPNTHHFNVLHDLADPAGRLQQVALDLLGLG